MTFKRPERASVNSKDERGRVLIRVCLSEPTGNHNPVKGNISRTITVANATVTEVRDAIDQSLFGEECTP